MTRASTPTILPLDQFAEIVGINPLYFSGAQSSSGTMQIQHDQRPIWPQFDWQIQGQFSRESLARLIAHAELDIANLVKYWPAPVYVVDEVHAYSAGVFQLNYKKLITGGKRVAELVDNPTVSYVFEDNIPRWGNITFTSDVDICELKVFFTGKNAERQWEIRPVNIDRVGSTVNISIDAWKLIEPDLQNRLPVTDEQIAIHAEDILNYVEDVEVYYVHTDHQATAVELHWRCGNCADSSCGNCEPHVQAACLHIVDPAMGLVSVRPASCACPTWQPASLSRGRAPDYVKVSYLSGEQENLYLEGTQCGQLSYNMAWLITILAASRIDYFFGANNNVQAFVDEWRRDVTRPTDQGVQFVTPQLADNPLGTRNGEITVFRALSKLRERVYGVGMA